MLIIQDLAKTLLVRVKDDSWSSDEQVQVLMRTKEALLLIESKQVETSLIVDRSECVLKYLMDESIVIGGLEEALQTSKFLWEKLLREAPQIQNKITPMMRTHTTKIRNDISSYESHINAYKAELAKAPYYLYATGTEKSLELLEAANAVYQEVVLSSCDIYVAFLNVYIWIIRNRS